VRKDAVDAPVHAADVLGLGQRGDRGIRAVEGLGNRGDDLHSPLGGGRRSSGVEVDAMDGVPRGNEVRRHGRTHVTQSDEGDRGHETPFDTGDGRRRGQWPPSSSTSPVASVGTA